MTMSGDASAVDGIRSSTKVRVAGLLLAANALGAAVVVGLAGWVLPLRDLDRDQAGRLPANLTVLLMYAPAAALVALLWGWWSLRVPGAGRSRTHHGDRMRRIVLHAPVRLALVQIVLWTIGLVTFVVVDMHYERALAVAIGAAVAVGGISTVTVAYRCTELLLRPEVARLAIEHPPGRRRLPGVLLRSLGSWTFGTGVPLAGLALTGIAATMYSGHYTVGQLGIVVIVLAVGGFLLGLVVMTLSSISTASSVMAVAHGHARVQAGALSTAVAVTDTTELGTLQAGFNRMVVGLRERQRVLELFGRHVGQDVARAALVDPFELGGQVRDVAVLFVDLVGSTSFAASHPATEVVAQLNRFFADVVDAVDAGGGWINKFEGDAALAIFGAPVDLDDPAGCALRTARTLSARLRASDLPLRAGIGVSAGEVVAGNIGDERRYEYTVIGDPVNEAARLSAAAKEHPGGVVASGSAVERAGGEESSRWAVVDHQRMRGRATDTTLHAPCPDPA